MDCAYHGVSLLSVETSSVSKSFYRLAYILHLACDRHEGSSSRIQLLRGGEGDGEEGIRRSQHFEAGIWGSHTSVCAIICSIYPKALE